MKADILQAIIYAGIAFFIMFLVTAIIKVW